MSELNEHNINENNKNNISVKNEIFEWFEAVILSLACVVLLFTFIFRPVGVDGQSMMNTLKNNDRVIITNIFYKPQIGDIVVITQPTSVHHPIIKRIIATENQTVDIDFETGTVYVDGKIIDETYIKEPTYLKYDIQFPVTVSEGCVFVMGDNRNNSLDSRSSEIGMIDVRYILGKAVLRAWPFDEISILK